jgi:LuxR family transcriptional regulator, maltose regulon positive regulatory protein
MTRSTEASARLRPIRGTDGTVPAAHAAGTGPYLLWFPHSPAASNAITLGPRPEMEKEERTESREAIAAPSHIIERPRLIKLMEDSGARVIVLHAPAGYGKTTLARQWLAHETWPGAWHRCTVSSTDVAALARSMAQLLDRGSDRLTERMIQRIATSASPEADASALAELLAQSGIGEEQFTLVVDDYHALSSSRGAESFLHRLVDGLSARVVITSRLRPSWILPRQIVYGEVLEIDRTLLAMTEEEARETLALLGREAGGQLIEYARGWPAVLGLAAALPETSHPTSLPTALLEFLADEVFQNLDEDAKDALLALSLSPSASVEDAIQLLGEDGVRALDTAIAAGFFSTATPETTELHPLLQKFLRTKLRASATKLQKSASNLVQLYLDQRRWDDAFSVAAEASSNELALEILDRAFDTLLAEGRIATLAKWLNTLDGHDSAVPLLDLGAAELAFREGLHEKSQRLAIEASRRYPDEDPRKAQALIRAGQAASQADDVSGARQLFLSAGKIAQTPHHRREALLGELFAALELESPDLADLVSRVKALSAEDLDTDIRRESALLVVALRTGGLLAAVERASAYGDLVDRIRDPFSRAAFTNALAHACNATARYRTALAFTQAQTAFSQQSGLNFAVPHTLHAEAMALMGLGRLERARRAINALAARATGDLHFALNAVVLRARHLLLTNRPGAAAAALSLPPDDRASAGLRAEYFATRSLALLALDREAEAKKACKLAAPVTRWRAESAVLVAFAEAVIRLRQGDEAAHVADELLKLVASTGQVDAFIVAHRTIPDVGSKLIHASADELLSKAFSHVEVPSDTDLGVVPSSADVTTLSRRESEVYALLCRGMSNREIAAHLFLSEKTVKVHLRHIYEKLGVKTRTQAALLSQTLMGSE